MSSLQLLVIGASAITFILLVYAVYLGLKLTEKRQQRVDFNQQSSKSQLDAKQSIKILAQALLKNDLTATEAAMRIAFLGKQIIPSADEAKQIRAFEQLASDTAHIPILEAWQALSAQDKAQYDKQRATLEQQHAESIQTAAQLLSKIELD